MSEPVKMEFGHWFDNRSHSLWIYDEIPAGMRPATLRDLWPGRQVLYQVETGPDKGKYYTGFCVGEERINALRHKVQNGIPVFVKQ